MKAIKRTVAALLATLMLATSTSFVLAAEEYSDAEAVAVAKVNGAGIMTGTDKGFEPSKSLTRAEAAAIIVRMKGISESAVKTAAGTTLFTDVAASHWASGYVNQASNLGIVKGVSATEFAPDREVTIAEFTTMAVRALGAGQLVDAEGTWPTNYVNFANEEGLLDDVNAIYTATATRLQAALIVSNSLDTEMWAKSAVKSNGELTWSKNGKTIIEDVLKLQEVKFVVDEISNNDSEVKVKGLKDSENKYLADTLKDGKYDVNEAFDLSTIKKGLTYTAYVDEDNNIKSMWIEDDSYEFSKIADNYDAADFEIDLMVNGKEKTYNFATKVEDSTEVIDAVLYINEKEETNPAKLAKNAGLFGSIVVNDKNEITAVYATQYDQFGIVDEVTKSTVKFKSSNVVTASGQAAGNVVFNKENTEYFLTKDGKGISYSDLKEGDAVAYYYVTSSKKYVGEVLTDSVEGKVTAISKTFVKIDGKKYEGMITGLNADDEIVAYINCDGRISFYEKVEEAAADMAIVSYLRSYTGKYGKDYEVQLLLSDGTETETLTVDLEDSYDELGLSGATTTNEKEEATRLWIDGSTDPVVAGHIVAVDGQLQPTLVGYEINGSKLTFCKIDKDETEYKDADLTVGDVTSKALSVGKKNVSLGNYYITESTKLIKLKADDEFGIKYEVVDFDDLDDVPTAAKAWVVGINDEDEVDTVYFGINYGLKATAETNFVFVKEVAETKHGDDKAYEFTCWTLAGDEVTYTYCKEEADETITIPTDLDTLKGMVVDFVVKDDMIMSRTTHSISKDELTSFDKITAADDMMLADVLSTRAKFTNGTASADKTVRLADDVLVILDKSTETSVKYELKSWDDIDEYDENLTGVKGDEISKVYEYEDDDDKEAIIVIFKDTLKD